jgi:hypothetical protein
VVVGGLLCAVVGTLAFVNAINETHHSEESFPSSLQNSRIFIFELNMGIVDNLVSQIRGLIVGGISRDLLVVVFITLRLRSHPGSRFGPTDFGGR